MINNILSGIQSYVGALELISKLKLWRFFAIPMLISFLTAIIIGFTAYGLSDNVGEYISQIWPWEFGKSSFSTFSNIIGGIIIFAIGLILYKHIILALSAPFMSTVSEKIELYINGGLKENFRQTTFQEQLIRGIRISIRNLSKELLISIPILLLKFIPIVNIFSTAILFLVQSYYAGFGNMDYTLERHLKYNESIKFVGKNKGYSIGNGIVFMLCLLIPIVGVITVLPLSVTAASVQTVNLLNKENERSVL